ncbi:dna repair protein rad5 [Lichtheimia corymbifera JMRC:FSU:9682]|uniref:Dna repair protein rad5 n=1 Tax=Lichtheimia corymbifera JMRC:FSU:9682 TaxID=1263082 RepID=A0A068SAH2_9FUNG|nr:dna repair protein rad5 [Lichtheimia corymbifera JMRC:FSU:9682]
MNPAERQYEQQATHRINSQRFGSGTLDNSHFNMLTTPTSESATVTATAKRPRLESDYQRPPFSLPARLQRAAFRDPLTMSTVRQPRSLSGESMARSQSVSQLSTFESGEQQQQQQEDMAVDENVCVGMIKTDIVTVRVIDLIKDDHYEPVNVISEGKRNHVNYSFTVTSRGTTRKFFGWVPFEDTKILGPLVDHKLIWWDAVIPRNKANHARTPLYIILYCQPRHTEWVFRMFEAHRASLFDPPFFNPACRYHNPFSNKSSASISSSSFSSTGSPAGTSMDTLEQTRRDIAQLLDSIPANDDDSSTQQQPQQEQQQQQQLPSQDNNQEGNNMIDGLLVPLLPHQQRGVKWMLDRENNESSSGGILADMGLGKTIQTIALMASTMAQHESEARRSTLIVTPLALIQQWANEIRTKTQPGKLKVLVYHGSNRSKDPATFANYDVVVTTYQVVASDMPNTSKRGRRRQHGEEESSEGLSSAAATPTPDDSVSPSSSAPNSPRPAASASASPSIESYGPLFQLEWHRVVLDEAQQIKNKNTRSAISCSELRSRKRWCLTGTPMQNHVDELYSLLRFLRIPPLDNYQTFKKTVSVPIQMGQGELAFERLKVVLMAVMLRRTKKILHTSNAESSSSSSSTNHVSGSPGSSHETLSLQLPSRDKKDVVLNFSKSERVLYELLSAKTKSTVEQLFRAGKGERNYLNMLCMLLRLRQACDHPQLVLRSIRADQDALDLATGGNNNTNSNNNRKEFSEAAVQRALLAKMAIDLGWQSNTAAMAGLGLDSSSPSSSSSSPANLCELCGGPLANADVSFCPPCQSQIEQCTEEGSMPTTSTKINKMLDILDETRRNHPKEKTIIFSQFTSMLDLMEDPLRRSGFKYCRYDGSMSNHLREKSLEALRNDPECTVMLISLKCGSLGLNLTAANHVILMDIWWNPAVEEQAIDRVHRIGQRLPVHVVRLVMDRTIEQKIIQLQQKKAQMVQGALGDGVIKNTKLTMKEIRTLFDL